MSRSISVRASSLRSRATSACSSATVGGIAADATGVIALAFGRLDPIAQRSLGNTQSRSRLLVAALVLGDQLHRLGTEFRRVALILLHPLARLLSVRGGCPRKSGYLTLLVGIGSERKKRRA